MRLARLAYLLLIMSACNVANTDDAFEPVTPDEHWQALANVVCEKMYACRDEFSDGEGAGSAGYANRYGDTVADCVALTTGGASTLQASIDANRVVYDDAAADACIDDERARLEPVSCIDLWGADLWATADTCALAYDGQLTEDESCYTPFDCGEDYTCSGLGEGRAGTCFYIG